jgi:DNA-binding NarL/FixJ family response regulator
MPDIELATRFQIRLDESAATLAAGVLDQLRVPAFLLDPQGRVTGLSAAAETAVRTGCAVRLRGRYLEGVSARDDAALRAAIDRVRTFAVQAVDILLLGPPGPLRVHIARVASSRFGSPCMVVTLPAASGEATPLLLDLGLTASEAAIAVALSDGERPQDIAAARRVSITTIRGQVREIYSKLDVRGVAQLTAKLRDLR